MKIVFDATPMINERTGIAQYTERLMTAMAEAYPDDEFIGFYYNFLGRRDTAHLPRLSNLSYMHASVIPSKIVYQLRRLGIEFPVESLSLTHADFVLYPNFLGYPSLFKTPSAPVVHDLTYMDLPEYVSTKLRSDLLRFVPKQIKRGSFVLTVSEFTKQRIRQEYDVPVDKIIVTPIPPDVPKTYPEDQKRTALKELGVTKPFILFVGTIEPRKNVVNLIEAYEALPAKIRNAHQLVIVGRIGWYCDAEVAKLAEAKQKGLNVLHLGYVTDQARDILYQSATLFSTASHYEGFGMPILEAMSYGTPCAISDIPVFREVAGDAGIYFDQSDPGAITETLTRILQGPTILQKAGKQGLARAKSYNWKTVASSVHAAIAASVKK